MTSRSNTKVVFTGKQRVVTVTIGCDGDRVTFDEQAQPLTAAGTWIGRSGSISARCTPTQVVIESVTPADGWHARVLDGEDRRQVPIMFAQGDDTVQIIVTCTNDGPPAFVQD